MWASTIPVCEQARTEHHDLLGWFREDMNRAYGSSIGLTFDGPKQLTNKKRDYTCFCPVSATAL